MSIEAKGDRPCEDKDYSGANGRGQVAIDILDANLRKKAVAAAKRADRSAK